MHCLCKQHWDEGYCVHVVMRGQARKEVQCSVTEDGGDWRLAVDVKKRMEGVGKRSARGRKKTGVVAMGNPVNLAERMCVQKHPRMLPGWMTLG